MIRVHGTCIVVDGAGVLLRGPSGAGKSDLGLRLIDGGACLVADDQVEIRRQSGRLTASPPATVAGLLEVRGLGIFRLDHLAAAQLDLVVDLVAPEVIERLPLAATMAEFLGQEVRCLALDPWEASAAAKVRLAVKVVTGNIMPLP